MSSHTPVELPLSDYIDVARHFRRSANVEKDFQDSSVNGDYILTPTALDSLRRLAEGLSPASASRAWTITGPYGVGKSSFAVFASRIFCDAETAGIKAREMIRQRDPDTAQELARLKLSPRFKRGFFPILLTARRTSAPLCIAEGIANALLRQPSKSLHSLGRKIQAAFTAHADGVGIDTKRVLSTLETTAVSVRNEGYQGILLIIDELGKLFEFAARYPQRGDVYVLQEIGEFVARSKAIPTLLLGLLHQSFEEYGHLLDVGTRREWSKIQGRFSDIPFLEPADQVVRMIGSAIERSEKNFPQELNGGLEQLAKTAIRLGIPPPGMPAEEFRRTALAAYPLHPLALVSLPYIFRRFGQNERSLFSYLSSAEPFGFQEFLRTRQVATRSPEFIRVTDLFDYFSNNFGLGLYRQPQAVRWLEAADVLERKRDLDKTHQDVVKTIGVLNVLSQFSHLSASADLISFALCDSPSLSKPLEVHLSHLKDASIITHRSYNNSYRIWEGSDVDLEERILEGKRRTAEKSGIAEQVRRYIPQRPIIARRHSFETGALRAFDVVYVDSPDSFEASLSASTSMDAKIIVCLSESNHLAEEFEVRARRLKSVEDIIIAIPQQTGELRGVIAELAALRWVWENTPELRDDRVARREVSLRITDAEQLLLRNLATLLDPRPEPLGSSCTWFYAGSRQKVHSRAGVSHILSEVMDLIYSKSPRIKNELVVRRNLSSAAAAARRNLIEAMLTSSDKAALDIQGYPPERSIYESVLRATGVHCPGPDGFWHFENPTKNSTHNLGPAWRRLSELIFERQPEPIPLSDLFAELSRPPFGVLDGLLPILICAFMQANRNEMTMYREEAFVPEPGINDFEMVLRRPDLFSVAGCRISGARADVVSRIAQGLKVEPATVPVVRALFRVAKGLPDFSWNTQRLDANTLAFREAFHHAKSPERFLFVELPVALGLPAFSAKSIDDSRIELFFELLNRALKDWSEALNHLLEEERESILSACGLEGSDRGWKMLREQAIGLEKSVSEPQLLGFLKRVIQGDSSLQSLQSVCALLASKDPSDWSDTDVEYFSTSARAIGEHFKNAKRAIGNVLPKVSIEDLSPNERRRAERVLKELQTHFEPFCSKESRAVMKAVLMNLMKRLDHDSEGGEEDVN